MKHSATLSEGTLSGLVHSREWIESLESQASQADAPEIERCELRGVQLVIKRGRLRGKAARRHALRRAIGLGLPRLREFENLAWLRKRLFQAPRPVFAGVVSRRGVPHFQFLATEYLGESRSLDKFLTEERDRSEILLVLARETARMHSLGFVHRDLYPRNLLVRGSTIAFLDAWRGGPGFGWRGPDHDLACLMLYGSEWLTQAEQERFFQDYFAQREVQDRAVTDRKRFAAAIENNRARLLARLEKRPHERRGRELPSRGWRVPLGH